jgi:glycosyltransferase involved in cell wall biosynthesis
MTDWPVFVINPAGATEPLQRQALLQALTRLLAERQPDIVQGCFADGMLYGIAAAKLAKVPVIVSSRRNAGHWISWKHRGALAILNRFVDSWQCNARTVEQSLVGPEWIPADRIEILPNALDLDRFQPPSPEQRRQLRQQLEVEGAGPVVVAVANLRRVKQLDVLVRAAALAFPQLPGLQLWLIGEGPERAALEREAQQLGLGSRVRLWGKQSDVRPWLGAADLAVLPSASEGASNAVLEYLAMGLPTLLSDIPANREVGMGMFFPVGDEQKLSQHLIETWGDPEKRDELSRLGREWVQQFSPERMASRVQGYYSRLMAEVR